MFTTAEYQVMRDKCPGELNSLLKTVGLSDLLPEDDSGDFFSKYDKLDKELTKIVCEKLKAETVIEGCYNLLKLAGIEYRYSESIMEIIAKVAANKDAIKAAAAMRA